MNDIGLGGGSQGESEQRSGVPRMDGYASGRNPDRAARRPYQFALPEFCSVRSGAAFPKEVPQLQGIRCALKPQAFAMHRAHQC